MAIKSPQCPLVFNQIAGGKSPPADLSTLGDAGASLVIYSTPCLFAAQAAIEQTMVDLKQTNGFIGRDQQGVDVKSCTSVLSDNLAARRTVAGRPAA